MFALVVLSDGTYHVCSLSDIYARKGNNCMLKKPKLRTKACIMAINGNMEHLSAIKENLNCNIPRVKLRTINVCKYKRLNRQKPRIIKSEIVKLKKIKIVSEHSHIQEKPETAFVKNNLPSVSQKESTDDMFSNISLPDKQDGSLCCESMFADKPDLFDCININKDIILTNDLSNCTLQIDRMNDNGSSTDLCFENIERTMLEKSDTQETLDILVEKSRANTDEDNYTILTNEFSKCALQMDTINDNRSFTDLCFKNIERTVLEKFDTQEKFDISVETSRANTNEDNYMILTNNSSNCALQMDTMNNNRSSTDLCFQNIEETDIQEKLDISVEKSRDDTDDDNYESVDVPNRNRYCDDADNGENRSLSTDEYEMNISSSKNQDSLEDCEDSLEEKFCRVGNKKGSKTLLSSNRHSIKDKPIKIKRRSTSPYGPTKRTRWNEAEKDVVMSAFGTYIDSKKLPSLQEINKVIQNSPCLKSRTAPQIKTWLHNQRKSRMQNK